MNTGTNNIGSKISADLLEDSDEVGQPPNIFVKKLQNIFVKGIAEVKFMAPDYSHTTFVINTHII